MEVANWRVIGSRKRAVDSTDQRVDLRILEADEQTGVILNSTIIVRNIVIID